MTQVRETFIEEVTAERGPHYEPYGWHHWPEHPWLSYQFRRQLGETQEGGGAVSECFDAARAAGVDATFELVPEEETGAEHCQHDNPGIGQNRIADWLAGRFGIDQRVLLQQKL